MKKCPQCNQVFGDENLFFLNDGILPKILKLKMFPDGAKIVYEELKASYPLN